MSHKSALSIVGLTLVALAGASESALAVPSGANYFVRPVLRVGAGAIQDGLQYNGATQATQTQNVTGSSWSTVNLQNGTVKMYAAESNGATIGGLQTFGSFGEQLTIDNGAGTNWTMRFSIEGQVSGDLEFVTPGSNNPYIWHDLSIVVFDEGVADSTNFFGIARDPCWGQDPLNCTPAPAPLAYEYYSDFLDIDVFGGGSDFYEYISSQISATVFLQSNHTVLDLFVFTNVVVSAEPGAGVANYVSDFSHTATFGQEFESGVDAFSSSGEFLGLSTPPQNPPPSGVPVPGVLALFGLGLACLGWSRRKNA